MPVFRQAKHTRYIMGKCDKDADLLAELTAACVAEGIKLGCVEALGAAQKARLAFYDQEAREYRFFELDEPLEITSLVGNVSLKDGQPIVHAHVTLADAAGRAYGGHLVPGTIVFSCEFCIRALEGTELTRGFDEQTHLPLWKMD